jgi:hypothetical protein
VKVGDVREGVVVSRSGQNIIVDAGLEEAVQAEGNYGVGERVTLRLISVGRDLHGQIETSEMSASQGSGTRKYWGYKVNRALSLGKLLQERHFYLKIGTSRYGSQAAEIWPSLIAGLQASTAVLVAFGSPKSGLREILQHEKLDPRHVFDYFLNMVPNQQTATVRTEEAILVSLGVLNLAENLARR